jgi:hypothetical protein
MGWALSRPRSHVGSPTILVIVANRQASRPTGDFSNVMRFDASNNRVGDKSMIDLVNEVGSGVSLRWRLSAAGEAIDHYQEMGSRG